MFVLRTVSICLVGVSACFALGLSAGRDEELDANSRSLMTSNSPANARTYSVAPEESNIKNESRTIEGGGRVIAQIKKELSDTSLALGLKITSLSSHGTTSTVKRLNDVEIDSMVKHVANLLRKKKWRDLIETTEIPWEIGKIRKKVFSRCLDARESPAHIFRYMKVHLLTTDTQGYDPKLLWWFDYVKKYRRLGGVGMIETAESDTATSHGVFDDKELFAFLVNEYDVQLKKETSSALLLTEMTPVDLHRQVVALFERLRHQSKTKKLATSMQFYLVSTSNIKQLVFDEWLHARVSPKTIFDILRVRSSGDFNILVSWLKYVKMYWTNVIPKSGEHYFFYDEFLRSLAEKSSLDGVTKLLKSNLFTQMFDNTPQYAFGTHAKNLRAIWTRWLWLRSGASPPEFFRQLVPSGKFELGDLEFLQGMLYVKLYRTDKQFPNKELFVLLSEKHSFEEIVGLFRWLRRYSGMLEISNDMLKFLTNPSNRQDPRETQLLRWEEYLPHKKRKVSL